MPHWLSRTGARVRRRTRALADRFASRRAGGMRARSAKRSPITRSAWAAAARKAGTASGGC